MKTLLIRNLTNIILYLTLKLLKFGAFVSTVEIKKTIYFKNMNFLFFAEEIIYILGYIKSLRDYLEQF